MKLRRVGVGAVGAMLVLGAGYSTALAATDTPSNATTSATSPGSSPQQPKVSQTDAMNIVTKLFPSLSKEIQNPMVTLQSDPSQSTRMVYEVNWNQMAFRQQAGPNLSSNFAHATVDATTGDVLQFNNNNGQGWDASKPVTLSAATKMANDWLNKLAPSKAAKLTLQPTSGAMNSGYSFLFVEEVDGIPAPFNQAEVDLDSSGNLVNYNLSWHDVSFPSKPSSVLDKTTAQQKFIDNLQLQLQYQRSFNMHGSSPIQLVYLPVSASKSVYGLGAPMIDATTGQSVGVDGKPTNDSQSAATPQPIVPGGPATFPTPKTESMTQSDAENEVRSLLGLTGDAWTPSGSGQGTSYFGGPFSGHQTWNVSLTNQNNDNVSVTVDATDGVILSYNYNSQPSSASSGASSSLSDAQAQTVADDFVKKLFPTMTGAIARDPNSMIFGQPDTAYEQYVFLVNGIPFRGLQVSVNEVTGQVENFNLDDDVSSQFPDPSKAISAQAAKSAYIKRDPVVLQYDLPETLPTSKTGPFQISYGSTAQLVYAGAPMPYGPGTLNALTGNWITQQPFGDLNPSVPLPKGTTQADQALALLKEHSIIVPGDKSLSAKDPISREQFIQWLSRAYNMNIGSTPSPQFPDVKATDPYASDLSEAILQGWLKNNGNVNPSASLTRLQAAQWIVQWMGWSGPTSNATFFKYPYSDSSAIPSSERGAATIVSDEGIIPLVSGKFEPNSNLSAGDAAIALVKAIKTLIAAGN
ncbi:YcdB/YcdC domain-containing protein [Alicyclobacillus dauci]|uniref:DUF4901 domain-containing protein n=1 Tax=Alicyclobacillus dauci TaxID=1475485 RepID=A0ABY6YXG6_9BACL|nr:YcdB/YcdC domain-containing protein [Alicyclobacillus dauci]WAH35292.1 DUF4901 domain-containing protein [Alicyclobacillus dauci]